MFLENESGLQTLANGPNLSEWGKTRLSIARALIPKNKSYYWMRPPHLWVISNY